MLCLFGKTIKYISIKTRMKMKDWIDTIEARTRAQAKYDKEHTKGLYIKLNIRTDLDIIQWLWAQSSKQGAIKALIREDIARKQNKRVSRSGNEVKAEGGDFLPEGENTT